MWGSTFTAIQVADRTLPPFLMAGVRFLIAGVLLYAVAGRTRGLHWVRPTGRELRASGLVGLLLLLGGNGLVCWAEVSVPSGIAALLIATVPLWMAVIGAAGRLVPSPGRVGWIGVAVGLAGVGILAGPGSGGTLQPVMVLALLAAALLWALGSLYSRTAPVPRNFLAAAALEMILGGAALVVVSAVIGDFGVVHWGSLGAGPLLALGWLVAGGSLLGYTCYLYALKALPTSTAATYAYVNPVVALVLGWLILGQGLTGGALAASLLITVGVVLMVSGSALGRRRQMPAVGQGA